MADTIYAAFENAAAKYPDEPAIIENQRVLTYSELAEMVDAIADGLPADVLTVGIALEHRAELIAAMLAVLKRGAMYVPVEPGFPAGRIQFMMEESEADFVLVEQDHNLALPGTILEPVDCVFCERRSPLPRRGPAEIEPHAPAYVLYTSGTTGRPKGVCVTNHNVCSYAKAFHHEFHNGPGDIMLQYSPCTFDIFVEEVFGALLNGAAVAIPAEEDKADIEALMQFVERHGVTMISGFPYLLADMNHLPKIPDSLRLLISGGDVLRGIYVDHLVDQVEVYNTYGPSETTVCASYYRCNDGEVLEDGTYPIGRPVLGADATIRDEAGNEVATGDVGEICITGDGVSLGYVGERNEENKAFVHGPDDTIMYRSGDLGYVLPDGNIAFLHRKDTQVMIYGKRVEVAEVEAQLYQCRNIRQALVCAFTDEQNLSYMTAYVVPTEEGIEVSEIVKELEENLASYMIPEFIVKMPAIPLNVNGKPDVSRLPVVLKSGAIHQ